MLRQKTKEELEYTQEKNWVDKAFQSVASSLGNGLPLQLRLADSVESLKNLFTGKFIYLFVFWFKGSPLILVVF